MSQFFYSHMQVIPAQGEKPATIENLEGSFSLDMVLRTMKMGDGRMIVILRDGHEHTNTYNKQGKSGKIEEVRVKEWVQSEIVLIPKDAERFRRMYSDDWEAGLLPYENEPLEKPDIISDDRQNPFTPEESLPSAEELEDIGVE